MEILLTKTLPYWFGKFENRLEENEKRGNKNGYIVNDKLTVGDLKLYYQLYRMCDENVYHIEIKKLVKSYPKLTAFVNKLSNLDVIKKLNERYIELVKEHKTNGTKIFKHDGKFVPQQL